jgi:Protein of unknown function (DUF2510)
VTQTPAGWYNDPEGLRGQRWWDGQRWTAHHLPSPSMPMGQHIQTAGSNAATGISSGTKAVIALFIAGGVALIGVGANAVEKSRNSKWHDYGYEVGESAGSLVKSGHGYATVCKTAIDVRLQLQGDGDGIDYPAAMGGCLDAIHDAGYN